MHPLREYVGCRARLAAHDALFGLFGSARVAKSARCPVEQSQFGQQVEHVQAELRGEGGSAVTRGVGKPERT